MYLVKNRVFKLLVVLVSMLVIISMGSLIFQILFESRKSVQNLGISMITNSSWRPVSQTPEFGLLNMIVASIYISFLSVFISMLLGISTAIYINYYTNNVIKHIILSFIDIVSGIPSIIFGFIGLSVVVKNMPKIFEMQTGQSVLAASVVLSIMILPFIVSNIDESVSLEREKYEIAALSVGLSKEYFIVKILFKSIKKGILAAFLMSFSRALGETMAVMMISGNSPIWPKLLHRACTIPSLIALEMGSIEYNSLHLSVLYFANIILLVIIFTVIILGWFLKKLMMKEGETL